MNTMALMVQAVALAAAFWAAQNPGAEEGENPYSSPDALHRVELTQRIRSRDWATGEPCKPVLEYAASVEEEGCSCCDRFTIGFGRGDTEGEALAALHAHLQGKIDALTPKLATGDDWRPKMFPDLRAA